MRRREGGASTLEFVLTMPLLLLFLMTIVQVGLVAHAQNAAKTAAEEGAAVARAFDGSAEQGRTEAQRYLDTIAGSMLTSAEVSARRDQESAQVTVAGSVTSLVPGWSPTISQSAAGPVERFVEES